MTRPTVHIVIVNWNTGMHLGVCIRSIEAAAAEDLRIRAVTVVDNASHDGSIDSVESAVLPLEIVRNSRNVGFAAGCNQGAGRSDADYVLFLNPDTQLRPETLSKVVRFMESDSAAGVGICGAFVVRPDGSPAISCSRFPTLRTFVGAMTGLDGRFPRLFPPHHLLPSETPTSRPVDQVIGAFFFVRGHLYTRLGGFDERFFVYFEDVDFSLRARQCGFGSYFLREAQVVHLENVSSNQVPSERLLYSLRSRLLYARLHWSRSGAWLLTGLTLVLELPARVVTAALRRDKAAVRSTLRGYLGLVSWIRRGMRPGAGMS